MGLTSGRGSHGGARRRRAGSARQGSAWQGDGGYNRTSLVGGDQQETAYGWNHYPAAGGGQRQATAFLDGAPAGRRAHARRRRGVGRWLTGYSAPVLSVVAIVVCAALVAAGLGVNHILTARSAADATANPNCTLIVPANPLTAKGLATPYQLTATDPAAGPCDESNDNQTAFVQGAVLNPRNGQVSIYDPLVVNAGTQPAVAPVVPRLPAGAVVAVWFGYNGNTLTLAGADQNLTVRRHCHRHPDKRHVASDPDDVTLRLGVSDRDRAGEHHDANEFRHAHRVGAHRFWSVRHRDADGNRFRLNGHTRHGSTVLRGHRGRGIGPVRRLRAAPARPGRLGRLAERQPERHQRARHGRQSPSPAPVIARVRRGRRLRRAAPRRPRAPRPP